METTDRLKKSPSGGEGHGPHVCKKCGWPFPNPRPSAKLRKTHKRVCGTIEGYKIGESKACLDVSDEEHLSDSDSKTAKPPINGVETVKKAAEVTVTTRSFSGIGSGSNRSTRSEDDVFSDAVTYFGDASGTSDSDDVRESAKKQGVSEGGRVFKAVADAGVGDFQSRIDDFSRPEQGKVDIDMKSQYHLSSSISLNAREEESLGTDNMQQCSDISAVLDSDENGSRKDEKLEDLTSVSTENPGFASKAVSLPQKVNEDSLDGALVPENAAAMKVIEKEVDAFGEKNDSFAKDSFDAQLNSLDNSYEAAEAANAEADDFNVLVVADEMSLRDHSMVLPENLSAPATLDPAPEDEYFGLGEASVIRDTMSNLSLDEPNKRDSKNYIDTIPSSLHQEIHLERNSEESDTFATDTHASESNGVLFHPDKDINESGQGKVVVTEERNPLVFADTSLESVKDESDILAYPIESVKPTHEDSERDNEDSKFCDALATDSTKAEEVEVPPTNETSFVYNTVDNLLEGGNRDDHDVRSTEGEILSASLPMVSDFEGWMEVEKKYGHVWEDQDSEAASPSEQNLAGESADDVVASAVASVGNVAELTYDDENRDDYDVRSTEGEKLSASVPIVSDFEGWMDDKVEVDKKYGHVREDQDSEAASPSEQILVGESADGVVASAVASVPNVAKLTYDDENSPQKASGIVDAIISKNVKDKDLQPGKIEILGAKDGGDKMSGAELIDKVDLGLISENEDDIELTPSAGINTSVHGTTSDSTDRDMKLVDQDVAVSEIDIQSDLISQADSVEGNWGSVSVLSAISDAPAAMETGSQPFLESVKAEKTNLQPKSNNGKSDMLTVEKLAGCSNQNEGAHESQASQNPQELGVEFPSLKPMVNESSGWKREEEIIAKVTSWSTGKQHMPLKSYLGESSPSAMDNPHQPISHETKKTAMHNKESVNDTVRGELGKEWNSPARYPANIKREKGKVRSRPLWAPFICCSSVETS